MYVIMQRLEVLMVGKVLVVVGVFLVEWEATGEDFVQIEMAVFVVEVLAMAVWAYKIERRIIHFDSRLHFRYPFAK